MLSDLIALQCVKRGQQPILQLLYLILKLRQLVGDCVEVITVVGGDAGNAGVAVVDVVQLTLELAGLIGLAALDEIPGADVDSLDRRPVILNV